MQLNPKKLIQYACVLFLLFGIFSLNAQVFNTGQTLKKGTFNLGINPSFYYQESNHDFVMFFHGSYGIQKGLDLSTQLGIGHESSDIYIGANLEKALHYEPLYVSLAGGFHVLNNTALDVTINLSKFLTPKFTLYGGFDMDIILKDQNEYVPWLFIGTEIFYRKGASFMLELEQSLEEDHPSIVGFGVNLYMR